MKTSLTKGISRLVAVFCLAFMAQTQVQAQCPGCVIDPSCPTFAPEGGLCPELIPAGTVGTAYDTDVTFYLPTVVEDPGTGLTVDVLEVVITAVNGLPLGLEWECNNAATGCVYNPPASPPSSELGCVKICGTPLGTPGTYTVTVEVTATVVALGLTLTQPLSYDVTFDLLESSSCATIYSVDGEPDCFGDYVADFTSLIDGGTNPTNYNWDFGNGQTSNDANPSGIVYTPGSYNVSCDITILDYVITQVNLNSMNDNWCGDVEEPNLFGACVTNPDPFFELRDASSNVIYTSSTIDDVLSATWSGLNVVVPPTFSIEFTDEDLVSGWDPLGTFSFSLTGPGTYSFSGAGGTSGTIVVGTQTQTVFSETCPVNAFGNPFIGPSASVTNATTVGGNEGAIDITIEGGNPPYTFFWTSGDITEDISGLSAGDYTVFITDTEGCSTIETWTVTEPANVPCDPAPDGLLALPFSGTEVLLSWTPIVQPADGYQVQGRVLGTPFWAGAKVLPSSFFVGGLTPGETYEWRVRARCSVTGNVSGFSDISTFTTPTVREGDFESALPSSVGPNPTSGNFTLEFGVPSDQEVVITITDQLGRLVHMESSFRQVGFHTLNFDLSQEAPGIYTVSVQSERGQDINKVVVH